jgi:RNA polymerase sigma-70 factor (ECF subfamily)
MVLTVIESTKGMEDDDARLLEGIRRGDGECARILYDRTRGFLLDAVIRPRVGAADAEDVLSETWLRAVERLRGFEWRGIGLLHWLSAIARRTALERLRSGHREEVVPDLVDIFGDVPDGAASAEAEMIAAERLCRMRERVAATLAELPPRHADALSLRLLEGRERADCAEAFGISIGAFDVLLHRAARGFARRWSQP